MVELVARYKEIPDDELRRLHLEANLEFFEHMKSNRRVQIPDAALADVAVALHYEANRRYKRSAWIWNRFIKKTDYRKWNEHFAAARDVNTQMMSEVARRNDAYRESVTPDDRNF